MFKSTTTRPIAEAYHIFVLYKHVLHTILEESCFWCSPLHLINQAFITNLGIYFNKTYTEKNPTYSGNWLTILISLKDLAVSFQDQSDKRNHYQLIVEEGKPIRFPQKHSINL